MRTRNLARLEMFFFKLRVFLALYAICGAAVLLTLLMFNKSPFPLLYLGWSIPAALLILGLTWPVHGIARRSNAVWKERKEKAETERFGRLR